MSSSWILRGVALLRTDVSEERIAYIIRGTRLGKLGKMLAVTSNRITLRRNTLLVTANVIPSSPSLVTPIMWRYVPPKRRILEEPHCVTS
jgi:hypothetical protein